MKITHESLSIIGGPGDLEDARAFAADLTWIGPAGSMGCLRVMLWGEGNSLVMEGSFENRSAALKAIEHVIDEKEVESGAGT